MELVLVIFLLFAFGLIAAISMFAKPSAARLSEGGKSPQSIDQIKDQGIAFDLQQHFAAFNTVVDAFDSTDDLVSKRAMLLVIERELDVIVAHAPENKSVKLAQAKLMDVSAALSAAESETLQSSYGAASVDDMRAGLQKVAYGMMGKHVAEDDKARFKQDMTEFASADPLVQEIAQRVRGLVAGSPGLLQSKIYGHFPEYDKEKVRYALYFAHELGLVHRKKKGNSYQLFPPGRVIDA